jgi:DNA-binding response OmpR family regulator
MGFNAMHMVLLIDDDTSVRTLIRAVLRREAISVDVAADAGEAIAKLRRRAYSAVLLDLMLGGSSGLEVLRFLKTERPEMLHRVVVVSTASDHALRCMAERALIWDVVRKPFEITHLVEVVRACRAQLARTATPGQRDVEMPLPKARGESH